ncbi:MAG: transposase, partial [Fastidiosipila sp.]|nr:transposase [Fastidiosipila sp.]
MGRKPRLEYPGGIYHVIQRGNNREFLFEDNACKEMLLDLLTSYRERLGFDLFGYVIMGNHYHLI